MGLDLTKLKNGASIVKRGVGVDGWKSALRIVSMSWGGPPDPDMIASITGVQFDGTGPAVYVHRGEFDEYDLFTVAPTRGDGWTLILSEIVTGAQIRCLLSQDLNVYTIQDLRRENGEIKEFQVNGIWIEAQKRHLFEPYNEPLVKDVASIKTTDTISFTLPTNPPENKPCPRHYYGIDSCTCGKDNVRPLR